MANRLDPDQTAPSGSALFAHAILRQIFRTFTVMCFPYFSTKICCGYSLEAPPKKYPHLVFRKKENIFLIPPLTIGRHF